jgi:DNA-binding MarR family transcriptional regulator/GNAT superfamily N-acetyltransferase
MEQAEQARQAEAVRQFNRFYTRQIGLLEEKLLRSPFSLAEARVLYELAHQETSTAAALSGDLGLDAGYLSRILSSFSKRGLLDKRPSASDGRQSLLQLTEQGRQAFDELNAASQSDFERMLADLSPAERGQLTRAMRTIERLLGGQPAPQPPYLLRPPQIGDMGWVVQRHGVLYAQEYGWDAQFEALVAEIVAAFVQRYDPKYERCWIAERDGENVGSVFIVRQSEAVAKLRLLLLEPSARGLGLGTRLVQECVRFAQQAGYQKITLWTNSVLLAARHIYERQGFRLTHSEPHHSFGHDLVGETWELELSGSRA